MIEYVQQLMKSEQSGPVYCTVFVKAISDNGATIILTQSNATNEITEQSITEVPYLAANSTSIILAKQKALEMVNQKQAVGFRPVNTRQSVQKLFPVFDLRTSFLNKATIVGFEQDKFLNWLCKTSTGKTVRCSVQSGITMSNAVMYVGRLLVFSKVRHKGELPFAAIGFIDQG